MVTSECNQINRMNFVPDLKSIQNAANTSLNNKAFPVQRTGYYCLRQ